MLIINSTYIADITQVEPHRRAHAEWVVRYIGEGIFLFAGPKKDKSGGIIVAKGIDAEQLSTILSEDSYVHAGVVENQIVVFEPAFTYPEFTRLRR